MQLKLNLPPISFSYMYVSFSFRYANMTLCRCTDYIVFLKASQTKHILKFPRDCILPKTWNYQSILTLKFRKYFKLSFDCAWILTCLLASQSVAMSRRENANLFELDMHPSSILFLIPLPLSPCSTHPVLYFIKVLKFHYAVRMSGLEPLTRGEHLYEDPIKPVPDISLSQ